MRITFDESLVNAMIWNRVLVIRRKRLSKDEYVYTMELKNKGVDKK